MERYEAKLSVMAFIGVFDELMRTVVPVSVLFSGCCLIDDMRSAFLYEQCVLAQDETPRSTD